MAIFSARTRVDLDDAALYGLTLPGGMVWRFVDEILRESAGVARITAPKRTGAMAAAIAAGRPGQYRRYHVSGKVHVRVPYASFVSLGTTGPIYSDSGRSLLLPPFPPAYPHAVRVPYVSGQRANPYLEEALAAVLASHRVAGR